jgi:hypothetical protein
MNHSLYHKYSNQELEWIAADSLTNYQTNLKSRYGELEQYQWIDSNITYKLNNHGFRCENFNHSNSVVFLGCSHTFGVGLPIASTWAQIVADSLKLTCYNLALPGTSNDTAFRLAYHWIEKIKPKCVIHCQIDSSRFELINGEDIVRFNSSLADKNILSVHDKIFYKKWVATDVNSELNKQKNILAIKKICNDLNIRIEIVDSHFFIKSRVDLARDLSHSGVATNKNFSDLVLKRF